MIEGGICWLLLPRTVLENLWVCGVVIMRAESLDAIAIGAPQKSQEL